MTERRIRFGILSTANIARTIVPAIAASRNAAAVAVASRDIKKARAFAARFGIEYACGSYEELLAREDIDAIYIAVPNSLHARWTIAALAAGKHVLCEKPIATNAGDARRMADAARAAGRHLAEGFMYRHHPMYDALFARLQAGAIGDVRSIDARFTFMDDGSDTVRAEELGGGALADVGCYAVHLARWVAGGEPAHAAAIFTGADADETFAGVLAFPNGVIAHIHASIASAETHGALITGTRGAIEIESPWHPGEDASRFVVKRWGEADEIVAAPGANAYVRQIEDFADAALGNAPPRWDARDAVANMRAMDLLRANATKLEPRPGM
ncbi:Gfo/Idh/MocA family oxidoreductase [bacterium]|nr:Gfo/Idh/MocA family oxidoreductase [bacterium]